MTSITLPAPPRARDIQLVPANDLSQEPIRILVVDDMPAIHADFRKILNRPEPGELDGFADALFGETAPSREQVCFEIDSACQGSEGLARVQSAIAEGRPYAIVFVDVRMPPGWDGVETSSRLWRADPDLQIVICTAYSDFSWEQITSRLGRLDNLLILKKPFDNIEVLQLAHALSKKWTLTRAAEHRFADLDAAVHQRTEEVRLSEQRFRTVIEKAPSAIALCRNGMSLYANQRFLNLFGFIRSEEMVGRAFSACWTPESRPVLEELFRPRALEGAAPAEYEGVAQRQDGSVFPAQVAAARVDLPDGPAILVFIADITHRKEAEKSLRENEARFRSYFELPLIGFAVSSPTKGWIAANERLCQLLGYSWDELRQTNWAQLTHPEDLEEDVRQFNRMMNGEIDNYSLEKRFLRKDGAVIWTSLAVAGVRQPDGTIDHICANVQDITERRQAEAALRESQQRLNLALRSASMGIWDWDVQTNKMTWDEQMFRLYGLPETLAVCGLELWEQVLHPEDKPKAMAACEAALRGDRDYACEFRVRHPDGTVRHIHAHGLVLRDKDGKPSRMLGINYDITERKLLEEKFRQAQKMEAIGLLAGGIAHDFNNILASIQLNLGLLRQNSTLDSDVQCSLSEVIEEAQRAASVTRQMLMFSRRSVLEVKTLDLSELVLNLLKMLKRLIGEHIDLQFSPNLSLPQVAADPGMIEQMLLNLCINARDAMPKGGKLTIALQTVSVDEARASLTQGARPGVFVCVSVRDTGCGMSEATLERIFEPFFTTKEAGKGTGLGLATVHGIVGQHRGWVEVKSQLGQGTAFEVFLPAACGAPCTPAPAQKRELKTGRETILLVEDEIQLRKVTARTLRLLGYAVIEAANAREALDLWKSQTQPIDLLLSDVVMPGGMTGLELAEQLCALAPGLRIILASGYSAEMVAQPVLPQKQMIRLQKPYDIEVLAKTVRQCLDER